MNSIEEDIRQAAAIVRRGGVILYPTDTVWGIGCDATNSEAVSRVFGIKRRADAKALIVLLGDADLTEHYAEVVPEPAREIILSATKPTTIIFDRGINLAREVMAEDGSVGIRVTHEEISRRLCRECRKPLVSTSANVSGEATPRRFNEISDEILSAVDYVMTSRRDDVQLSNPSTIIKINRDLTFKIIRE